MSSYYNEHDPYAAQWLRNLIAAGHIAPGDVDERSIEDVRADELAGYRQCHFFAGIGVWSYALRCAGWPDDRPVWTGSCPCQPFSAAGRSGGFGDGRHLWPHWARLIGECRPGVVFGEQVASPDALAWLDFVCADLEAAGYAVGAVDTCSAGFGAPHIRQRLYFVANADEGRSGWDAGAISRAQGEAQRRVRGIADRVESGGAAHELADAERAERRPDEQHDQPPRGREQAADRLGRGRDAGELADTDERNASAEGLQRSGEHGQQPQDGGTVLVGDAELERPQGCGDTGSREGMGAARAQLAGAGPTNGFWRDADWLPCTDGKARAAKSGIFPLATGITNRVGMLCAAGNALCAPQAEAFVRAFMSVESVRERELEDRG